MKPLIEKPYDPVMRFFTPELYTQYNSPDEKEVDRADQAWEEAISHYEKHLKSIWERLPSQVRKLTKLHLHDAELLGRTEEIQSGGPFLHPEFSLPTWSAVGVVTVKQQEKGLSLIYLLWDRIREYGPREGWRFSKEREHWLYDELDTASGHRGAFIHRVLLSSGMVLEIPFWFVVIHRFLLPGFTSEIEPAQGTG